MRERFEVVERLEAQARDAFMHYRNAVLGDLFGSGAAGSDRSVPRLAQVAGQDGKQAAQPDTPQGEAPPRGGRHEIPREGAAN